MTKNEQMKIAQENDFIYDHSNIVGFIGKIFFHYSKQFITEKILLVLPSIDADLKDKLEKLRKQLLINEMKIVEDNVIFLLDSSLFNISFSQVQKIIEFVKETSREFEKSNAIKCPVCDNEEKLIMVRHLETYFPICETCLEKRNIEEINDLTKENNFNTRIKGLVFSSAISILFLFFVNIIIVYLRFQPLAFAFFSIFMNEFIYGEATKRIRKKDVYVIFAGTSLSILVSYLLGLKFYPELFKIINNSYSYLKMIPFSLNLFEITYSITISIAAILIYLNKRKFLFMETKYVKLNRIHLTTSSSL